MPLSLIVHTLPILLQSGNVIQMILPVEDNENVKRIKNVKNVFLFSYFYFFFKFSVYDIYAVNND